MANKSALKSRADIILKALKTNYPDAHCALNYQTPFQLLIATILSAQCTDERVNQVTQKLFKKYPDSKSLAKAELDTIEEIIRSTGFFKNKAKSLKQSSEIIERKFQSKVPSRLEDLIQLPGVGRKTANVVLGNAYNIASGVVVDTHVFRLSRRFGWSKSKTPESVEQDLIQLFDNKEWVMLSHYLISHGRALCKARKPSCSACFLKNTCPKIGVTGFN